MREDASDDFSKIIYKGPNIGFYGFHSFLGAMGSLEGIRHVKSEWSAVREAGEQLWSFPVHCTLLVYRYANIEGGDDVLVRLDGRSENISVVESIVLEEARKYNESH
jgi:hypothetical protein